MRPPKTAVLLLGVAALGSFPSVPQAAHPSSANAQAKDQKPSILWREPASITEENLFYGPGGEADQPHGRLTFVDEDLSGSTPKFVARDEAHATWTIKLGSQAQPEVAATRLVWAVGYTTDEDYFLASAQIEGLPAKVHRGQSLIGANGVLRNVRLERKLDDRKTTGSWKWRDNMFSGTRELNGFRTLMAVLDNWDLKDDNNRIHEHRGKGADREQVYEISDLGASFGSPNLHRTAQSIGNLQDYRRARFITKMTATDVNFSTPGRPAFLVIFNTPEYIRRLGLLWIGKSIPREDARWMGQLLGRLSRDQIRDAFRAAGYSADDVEGFASVVEARVAQLNAL